MMMEYTTPTMSYSRLYAAMLGAGHTLIAGAQGSGKSTVLAGLIHTALKDSPAMCKMILCDLKRVDMVEYSQLPHVERYATTPKQIAEALRYALAVMEARYNDMAKRRLKEYDGAVLYVFIDEVADLLTDATNKRTFTPLIQRLAQLGRAARITVIMATQCCLASILSTSVKCNFPSRVALRTATAQDSRNIIDMRGGEQLPNPRTAGKAYGIWRNGADVDTWVLPRYDEAERQRIIDHWTDKRNSRKGLGWFGRRSA
jgi:DNA segregation ATPase FtsK/SpoIIIE-like protein